MKIFPMPTLKEAVEAERLTESKIETRPLSAAALMRAMEETTPPWKNETAWDKIALLMAEGYEIRIRPEYEMFRVEARKDGNGYGIGRMYGEFKRNVPDKVFKTALTLLTDKILEAEK